MTATARDAEQRVFRAVAAAFAATLPSPAAPAALAPNSWLVHVNQAMKLNPNVAAQRCGIPTIVATMQNRMIATRWMQIDGAE